LLNISKQTVSPLLLVLKWIRGVDHGSSFQGLASSSKPKEGTRRTLFRRHGWALPFPRTRRLPRASIRFTNHLTSKFQHWRLLHLTATPGSFRIQFDVSRPERLAWLRLSCGISPGHIAPKLKPIEVPVDNQSSLNSHFGQ